MKNTAIEWAENTVNFYVGCTKVSQGCKECYMYRIEKRFGRDPSIVRKTNWITIEHNLKKWEPSTIFVNSMSDSFHESLSFEQIDGMFDILEKYPQHTYIILTKRAKRLWEYLTDGDKEFYHFGKNFWFGVSVETINEYDRIDMLSKCPVHVRFVSFEPLLGGIILDDKMKSIHWAIIGGESGNNYRETKKEWFELLIEGCREYNVPVFLKQLGGSKKCKCHNAWGCRLWNGITIDEMPKMEMLNDTIH